MKPLLRREEGQSYTPGAGEYAITEHHSFEDILLHMVTNDCPGMTRQDACDHLIELLRLIREAGDE
jgi:hypothetical protein